ncbi:hypothetical protein [Tsuneonella suprasediminis]|uniref:hypothetical protein n=1 Tax=Tsuneonella suprasediminis TaxID=2306996 RepID=UPI002F920273
MSELESTGPLWTQEQAIAYEAAQEAINDVISGYSAQIAAAEASGAPNSQARVEWLSMRMKQAYTTKRSLKVTDTENVQQALLEYSAIVRARNAE